MTRKTKVIRIDPDLLKKITIKYPHAKSESSRIGRLFEDKRKDEEFKLKFKKKLIEFR